jgi:phosphate transport system permease protein
LTSAALKPKRSRASGGDALFSYVILGLSMLILLVVLSYFILLLSGGFSAIATSGISFLTGTTWDPANGVYSAFPFIVGTLLTAVVALIIAIPLALASALFITEYAPRWLSEPVGYLVELLAAIPSVVYGLWGIFVLLPLVRSFQLWFVTTTGVQWPPSGFGVMTASILLSIMIIPFIASISRDVIRLVPNDQREAAYALGATKWEVIRTGILPYARAGIFGGIILGLGRAIGETLAVTMVIGNVDKIPGNPFDQGATMSSIIASQFPEATGNFTAALVAIGLLMLVFSVAVNYGASVIIRKLTPAGVRL